MRQYYLSNNIKYWAYHFWRYPPFKIRNTKYENWFNIFNILYFYYNNVIINRSQILFRINNNNDLIEYKIDTESVAQKMTELWLLLYLYTFLYFLYFCTDNIWSIRYFWLYRTEGQDVRYSKRLICLKTRNLKTRNPKIWNPKICQNQRKSVEICQNLPKWA